MNSPTRGSSRTSPSKVEKARAYLSRYETDRRSIFVGSLPVGTTEDEVRELFTTYGEIVSILVRHSTSRSERKYKSSFSRIFC